MEETIARIARMEGIFDTLREAGEQRIRENPALHRQLAELVSYYENGRWLRDYELDEQGLLPPDLKRGVLAQDAVYDFLDGLSFVPSELRNEEDRHEV